MGLFQDENIFNAVLERLDFSIAEDISHEENPRPEIVFVDNPPENLHPKHYIALEFAKSLDATAVYFRYYEDNRFCVPQVYFYDFSKKRVDKNRIAEIHRNIYSSNQVPLMAVISDVSVELFDTKKPVEEINENEISNKNCIIKEPFSINKQIDLLEKFFNAKKLNSGLFWESNELSNHFLRNSSAYEKLIEILNKIKIEFVKDFAKNNLSKDFAEDLLFKCILIKYLEENGKDYKKDHAKEFYKRNNLEYNTLNEILTNKKTLDLFIALEKHFNGGVFEISPKDRNGNIDLIEKQKRENYLRTHSLEHLAEHLDGYLDRGNQKSLWQQYSFKYMPIELISNFYEEFIQKDLDKNKGTVYTPSYLVNLLVDECLPISTDLENLNENVKLADVSCGSGIFITTAFKRLVQRLRIQKWLKQGKPNQLPKPTLKEVKDILKNNIFGVDSNSTAVKLSKFSLQLAICQLLPNEELWTWNNEKIFQDLDNENIFYEDFFDFISFEKYRNFHSSFDLIIGNPPFYELKNTKKEPEYNEIIKNLKQRIGFEFSVKIPNNQLSLMFLEVSRVLLRENADLCLIQKSTSLLHNKQKNVKAFRNNLFNNFHVYQIIDFTILKEYLYKSKSKTVLDDFGKPVLDDKGKIKKSKSTSVETCAVFYKNKKIESYNCLHIVSKLLKNTKEGLFFEFDYYDFYELSKEKILKDETIWRCNLLGGNRLNDLVRRLNIKNSFQTNLKDFLYEILNIEEEKYGVGFQIASKKDSASFITNKRILLGKNFGVDKLKFIKYIDSQKFHRTRSSKLYESPIINIKTAIEKNKIAIILHDVDTAFNETIVGISFSDNPNFNKFYNIININNKVHILQTVSTSSMFYLGATMPFQKQDIDNWTIPLNSDKIKISFAEEIIMNDVLEYIYPSWYEKKPKLNLIASNKQITDFADIFNQSFNSIYKKNGKEQYLKRIIEGDDFFALEFFYGNKVERTKEIKSNREIENILKNQKSRNAIINRIMKIYGKDSITFVKPKNLRYWLKSIALRDADDVFDDMIENGY